MESGSIAFPPFELDLGRGQLLSQGRPIALRRRTWDVLRYLAHRPGQLVSKEELLDAVWGNTSVAEVTLSTSIRELRQALGDDARAPRYLETVHRRGFRFLGVVASPESATAPSDARRTSSPVVAVAPGLRLVGRDDALAELRDALQDSLGSGPRVVLVRGEAGIGKSAVVKAFGAAVADASSPPVRFAVGRSVGYLHGAPPHLPVTEALEHLAAGPDGAAVTEALTLHAPEVLAQMPWLATRGAAPATARGDVRTDSTARMTRVLEALATRAPLVLVIEDAHDADTATVDLLARVLETASSAPLLLVATYRPAEAILGEAYVREGLARVAGNGAARTIDLELLPLSCVVDYLRGRDAAFWDEERCRRVHRHSGGNALFMAALADTVEQAHLHGDDALPLGVPQSLHGLVDAQFRRLDYAQREILAAASACGLAFSSMSVAAATGLPVDAVESACETLASGGNLLERAGVADWPSGSVGQAYAFRHDLYRGALYDALPTSRRQALHLRVGEALEAGFAGATVEVAVEIADHFERCGDGRRAVPYLRDGAAAARGRFAHRESLRLLRGALDLLLDQEPGTDRDREEFALQVDIAASTAAVHGQGSRESQEACRMVEVLGRSLEPSVERFLGLLVVFRFEMLRSSIRTASAISTKMTAMADQLENTILQLGATSCAGMVAMANGDLAGARRAFERVIEVTPREFRLPNFRDVLIPSQTALAQVLCLQAEHEAARRVCRDTIERADWLDDPFERACTRVYAGHCEALLGDRAAAAGLVADGGRIARDHGIEEMAAIAAVVGGWAARELPMQERLRMARDGVDGLERTGHRIGLGLYLSLLVDLEIEAGDVEGAHGSLHRALTEARTTGARTYLADIQRQHGRLLALRAKGHPGTAREAERWFEKAAALAAEQGAELVAQRLAASR